VVITVYADRSFSFETKTPPASVLLKKAAKIAKGSDDPKRTKVGKVSMVVNRVKNGLPQEIGKAVEDFGLDLIAAIPEDPNLSNLEIQGKPIIELPEDSPLKKGVQEIITKFGL